MRGHSLVFLSKLCTTLGGVGWPLRVTLMLHHAQHRRECYYIIIMCDTQRRRLLLSLISVTARCRQAPSDSLSVTRIAVDTPGERVSILAQLCGCCVCVCGVGRCIYQRRYEARQSTPAPRMRSRSLRARVRYYITCIRHTRRASILTLLIVVRKRGICISAPS